MAVLNVGIGGNRVLSEGSGPSALSRIDRDVLAQPGATHLIFLEGINDIGGARERPSPSAADVIAGHRQVIELKALNDWIRTAKAYDGVIDFDAAIRDPQRQTRTLPQYDPGDHLHANGDGYRVMAEAIDLNLFRAKAAGAATR
jgi:lysophospholipase L1-like esterase